LSSMLARVGITELSLTRRLSSLSSPGTCTMIRKERASPLTFRQNHIGGICAGINARIATMIIRSSSRSNCEHSKNSDTLFQKDTMRKEQVLIFEPKAEFTRIRT
jgi:hypothetical protein